MFHVKNRMQPYLPMNVTYFNDRKYDYLQKTIYHTFRTVFLPFLPVKIYDKHFDKTIGRKTKDVQSMLGLFILQALFDLKDSEAVEAYTFDQKFHYALDIKESEAYLSARAFYYYKTILLGTEDHIFEQVLNKIFDEIQFDYSLQRTDSSLVRLNLKKMSQWELFKSTLTKALREIKNNHPVIFERVPEHIQQYLQNDENNTWFSDFTPSKANDYLVQAARDVLELKELFESHSKISKLESFQLVLRLINEQVDVDDQGQIKVEIKEDCKGTAMANPHDPDAQYSGHKKDIGVKLTTSETCAPDKDTPNPQIITHAEVTPANTSDRELLQPSIDARDKQGFKPDVELTDNGFESDANHQALQEKDVDLIAPPTGKPPEGFGVMDFELHEDGQSINACPMGQACIENKIDQKNQKTSSYFDPGQCRACPHSRDCPVKITKRKAKVSWKWNKPRLEARRLAFQEDQELINLFKQRAGGEAGFSQLKVNLGLDRLRCRGSVKSKFKIIMAVTALNIKRAFNWMKGGSSASRARKNKDFEPDTGILLFFLWLFCSYLRKTLILSGLRPKILH